MFPLFPDSNWLKSTGGLLGVKASLIQAEALSARPPLPGAPSAALGFGSSPGAAHAAPASGTDTAAAAAAVTNSFLSICFSCRVGLSLGGSRLRSSGAPREPHSVVDYCTWNRIQVVDHCTWSRIQVPE